MQTPQFNHVARSTLIGQRVGYIRVSTASQNTARQLDGIALDRTFTDKASGNDSNRPQLQAALTHLRDGDIFIVHSMDRLARNLDDLRKIVSQLNERGVAVEFVKEHLLFTTDVNAMSKLLLSVMGAFAEFERALIRERQREGIEAAKRKGMYKGRKPSLTADKISLLQSRVNAGENRSALAREFQISRETLYKYASMETKQRTR